MKLKVIALTALTLGACSTQEIEILSTSVLPNNSIDPHQQFEVGSTVQMSSEILEQEQPRFDVHLVLGTSKTKYDTLTSYSCMRNATNSCTGITSFSCFYDGDYLNCSGGFAYQVEGKTLGLRACTYTATNKEICTVEEIEITFN